MANNIGAIEFVIFDLETTGLDPVSGDRIVEIAAVRIKDEKRIGEFQSLVNPGKRLINPAAFAVNQITQDMLKDAPRIDQVLPRFLSFAAGSCLAAYNASFDMSFLSLELDLIKKKLAQSQQVVDILTMARRLLPELGRYKLGIVSKHLGIDVVQQHRAFSDVCLAEKVFCFLNNILASKGIFDFEQFVSLFGLSSELLSNITDSKIARIQQALDLGVSLKIEYLARSNAELTERDVIPQLIIYERDLPYLVGYCNLRKRERTFKIQNILHLEMQEPLTNDNGLTD